MPGDLSETTFDALVAAQKRGLLPTSLGTADLRDLGEMVLSRSVFSARASNLVFVSEIKRVVDAMASGEMDEASGRMALLETLTALGYSPETGGFPDEPVEPARAGSLQDLSAFRRLQLIVETQRGLMVGAGQKLRGQDPNRLELFPAWELVRQISVSIPRDWQARWTLAGGRLYNGARMVALKGDPIWGELGSWHNFEDALGVDHPPFAFNSGMGWVEVTKAECRKLGVGGPDGMTMDEFLASRPETLDGRQPLPAPVLSMRDLDPELAAEFGKGKSVVISGEYATTTDGSDDLAAMDAAREARRKERMERDVADAAREYERRGK